MAVEFKHLPTKSREGEDQLLTIASGPVIIEGNKVLLDKHGDDGFWKFPGGSVNSGDSFHKHASEQVRRELGIEIDIVDDPFVLQFVWERQGKTEIVILIHYFARRITEEIIKGDDVKEYAWFDIDNLPPDCAPNIAPVVEHFRTKHDVTKPFGQA